MKQLIFIKLRLRCFLLVTTALTLHLGLQGSGSVTYEPAGGRLGDQLIGYLHTKWVAYEYDCQLYYKPFMYSSQLILHDKEVPYERLPKNLIPSIMQVDQKLEDFIAKGNSNTLHVIPYFPESLEEFLPTSGPAGYYWSRIINYFPYFKVNWNDSVFKKSIQKLIAPKCPIKLIKPPKDKISIAIQVRKNSAGFDSPLLSGLSDVEFDPKQLYNDVVFPLKHPPEDYYVEQLKRITTLFSQAEFYVFVFTDDPQPLNIINNFRKSLPYDQIEFDYRALENNHFSNVLEDLFSMLNFDCLIRPDSNLSIVASRLGDFKIIISPAHHRWEGKKLIIDQVLIEKFEMNECIAIKI